MNDLDTELTAGLSSLVDSPAPPSAMNVALARRTGHAIRRRRTATRSTAAAAAAAAVLGAVLLPGIGHRSGPPPGSDPTASPGATATVRPVLTGTDPLVTTLSFGWLPDGVTTASYDWADQPDLIQNVAADGATLNAGGDTTELNLTVLPVGQTFPPAKLKGAIDAPQIPAPDVNGRPAYWTHAPGSSAAANDGLTELRWELAAGQWAQLDSTFGSDTSAAQTPTIYRVAQGVRYGGSAQVALPFHLDHAPAGLSLDAAHWAEGNGWINGFGPGGPTAPPGQTDPVPLWNTNLIYGSGSPAQRDTWSFITIGVEVDTGQKPGGATKPTTVDGHPAILSDTSDSVEFSIYGLDGLNISIFAQGATAMSDINAAGGVVPFLKTITLLGPNPANWTTAVVG